MARAIEMCLNRFLFHLSQTRARKTGCAVDRIIISRTDSIGDFILFTPCLAEFRKIYSNAHIVLLVQDITFGLAEACPYVDEVWQINHRRFRRNILEHLRWYRKMSSAGFDIAIEAVYSTNFSFLECLIGWTGAPRRIGFECTYAHRKRERQNPFFTEFIPEQKGIVFEMERNSQLLRHLGATRHFSRHAEVWLRREDLTPTEKIQTKMNGKPYAILFPGAAKQSRMWPSGNYIEAIAEIYRAFPMHWIICGGYGETGLCETIAGQLRDMSIPAESFAGKTTLRELYGLFKGAAFYLGNESMAAHLAAAADIPAVTILGGAYYGRFYPYPDNALTVAVTNELPCWGCNWVCRYEEPECIKSVAVEDVVRAARNLLETHFDTTRKKEEI